MCENQEDRLEDSLTGDIQHDLAMMLADGPGKPHLYSQEIVDRYAQELQRRGEPLPVNCKWEFSPYHRGKEELVYDLVACRPQATTIDDIKAANVRAGKFFFSPDTMRFFKSRTCRKVYEGPGGIYFVTSEQYDQTTPRSYTVRQFVPETGVVNTVEEFQKFSSLREARSRARYSATSLTIPATADAVL